MSPSRPSPPTEERLSTTSTPPSPRSLVDQRRSGPATPRSAGHEGDGAHQDRPIVVLRDVTKTYPNGKTALRDVDLVVPEGDFVFLVGPSGAGKSTPIHLLIRAELPTSGEIVLGNADLARLPRRQVARIRRKIGIVFQDFKLLP